MLQGLCLSKNNVFFKIIVLLSNILILFSYKSSFGQSSYVKSLPLSRLEYSNGTAQCGYYDAGNKKLYNCDGAILNSNVMNVKVTADEYCCSKLASGGCSINSLASVQFRTGSLSLSKDAQTILSLNAEQIKANPACKIRITGYGTSTKQSSQNSWDRVNAVIKYLVERQGISPDRFIFEYGLEGDPNTIDFQGTTEDGPNSVPAPHPNLRRGQ